ncbi:hypothetical protein ACP70R_026842 [Stipagrostis hirtigluma subsp. patula]
MASSSLLIPFASLALLLLLLSSTSRAEEEAVLTLDAGNFSEAVAAHQFIVVEFHAPWCGHCKQQAPEYEKASILSKHDPPIVLAKDGTTNDIPSDFTVEGYPAMYFYSSTHPVETSYHATVAGRPRIIDFISKNKGSKPGEAPVEDDDAAWTDDAAEDETEPESVKDEL